jgi:hypothetical protein
LNDIDKARLEVRETLKHLFKVITDELPGDLDKDEKERQAEYTLDMLVDAELAMVQNYLA